MFDNESKDENSLTPDGRPTVIRTAIEYATKLLISGKVAEPQLYIIMVGMPRISDMPTMRSCVIVSKTNKPVFRYGLDSQLPLHVVRLLDFLPRFFINEFEGDQSA